MSKSTSISASGKTDFLKTAAKSCSPTLQKSQVNHLSPSHLTTGPVSQQKQVKMEMIGDVYDTYDVYRMSSSTEPLVTKMTESTTCPSIQEDLSSTTGGVRLSTRSPEVLSMKGGLLNGWRLSKEETKDVSYNGLPRPSVIQHTHSAGSCNMSECHTSNRLPYESNNSSYTSCHYSNDGLTMVKNSFSNSSCEPSRKSSFVSTSQIPLAHSGHLSNSNRYHPYNSANHGYTTSEFLGQNTVTKSVKMDTSSVPYYPSTDNNSNRPLPYKQQSLSPWVSASPHGCPTVTSSKHRPNGLVEKVEDDGVVLDLSVKKSSSRPPADLPWANGERDDGLRSYQKENKMVDQMDCVQELDLSMKSKSKRSSSESNSVGIIPLKGNPTMTNKLLVKEQPIQSVVEQNCNDECVHPAEDQTDFRFVRKTSSTSPLPTKHSKNILSSNSPPSIPVMPSQYFISDGKTPAYFPEYGPQISTLLPPHYYGLSFPVSSSHPPLVPEQFQASLSTYKELIHKGMFPATSYPPYAFSTHLYPSMYKEQTPYFYLPK